ncbi:TPA: matrix-binding protein EbhB, partial [Streptococcus suis]|nr:matrix-binding protein EbhB [Streptococcus suis]
MLSLLDKTVRTAKWHGKPLPETIKASVKETLNGDFVLNFTYPITDSGLFRELKEDYLVRSLVPVLGHQLFRIKKVIEGDTSLEVVAYHISDDIMTRLVSPFRCEQVPCATALSSMVMASKSPLGDFSFTSDIVKNRTYTTDKEQTLYSSLLDGKHSIIGTWEGELVRDNLALTIKVERGQDRGVVISTHYNLKKYQRTKESSQIITRIHATSSFKQEGQDRETVLQVTVDSPLINSYPFINEVTYTNNNLRSRQELIEWASSKFRLEGIDKPKDAIIIEAFELDGQTVHLGDTVTLKSKLHGIDVRKKAIAYDYDPLAKNYRSITFDDKASIGTGKTGGSLTTLVNNLLDGNKRSEDVAVEIALENANRAFDVEFEKRQVAIDTAIEQAQSRGEVYADRLKASIDSELSTIHQQMRQQEEEQKRTTRDLLAKAGVNTNLATEAKQKAEQAQTGATEALRRAEQAKLDAIQEANRLTSTERSQTETKIATAKSQAISEASRLVDVAKSLLSGQLATVSTNLSQTKEDIKLLASKQLVDSLTGRVTGAESMIQVQADQISQRVKTSDFNQAKQRIETAESSITQLGNRITTEISQTVAKIPTSIGGRNLFKGSRDFSDVWYNAGNGSFFEDYKDVHIHRTKTAWLGKSQRISVKSGEIYTFSFYAKSDSENDGIMFYLSHSGTGTPAQGHPNNKYIAISTDYQRYSITFKITSNGIIVPRLERTNTTSFLFFGGFKLETGSISTDWSPAPEDFSNEIESVKTTITQTASGVEQVSTRLTEANGKISSSETQIRQLVSDVSSKVSQTDFNNLKRTVEGHTTSIQQTQQSILLKADKTVLEGVKTTADNALAKANTNASQITQTKADLRIANDAISQKVAKTDFNSLTGRVASAESTIRTQAGQIEQRLTSTQVESAINSKGYQTKSQVDSNITGRGYLTSSSLQPYATTTSVQNLVRSTSDSFTQRISQTESRIPTSVSHRNLIAGTSDRWSAYQTINVSSNWIASLGRVQFGDSSGIYIGSKVHLYVHISADEITFDPAVTTRSMRLQGPILDSQNVWTWTNWNLYHPFYNKWSSNLITGNNYRLIKLTATVT